MDKHRKEPQPEARSPLIFRLMGVEWPIPRWALAPSALILLLALAAYAAQQFELPLVVRWRAMAANEAERNEAYKHSSMQEQAIPLYTDHRDLSVNLYKSDGCLQVVRHSGAQWQAQWLIAAAAAGSDPAPGRISTAPAVGALPWEGTAQAQGAPRGCLNPHPGSFRQREGERRGCWQQEFREWNDGCRHYQWFDTCHRVWDVNPDGSPRVYWTVCRH